MIVTPIRAILLDIEGTTTPISFVHETLFTYARSQIRNYLGNKYGSAEVEDDLARLRHEQEDDVKQNLQPPALITGSRDTEIDSIVRYVNWLIERDRKSTGLKSLQGKMWRQGYFDGTLKAPLFADVVPALERWHREGLQISIFSSGSVLAQKLLFGHTQAGDLTNLINSYFNTATGPKTDADSYRRIAAALGLAAVQVLFISDVVGELDAASTAGMKTLLSLRPGNPTQPSHSYSTIQTFDNIPS